jgi:hypothetical protein
MPETASSATGTYGETVKWILAIAAGAIAGAFLHLKEIEEQRYLVQGLLGLSLILFVISVWAGTNYLLWLNVIPVVREKIREYSEDIAKLGPSPMGAEAQKKADLERRIGEENKKIGDAEETKPSWFRFYTRSFTAALACATVAIVFSAYSAAAGYGKPKKDDGKKDCGKKECVASHVTHYSMVYSAVHTIGKNRREAHTFLMNDGTGDLWQMICDRDGHVVFQKVTRIDQPISSK